jgi:hypothetical protein
VPAEIKRAVYHETFDNDPAGWFGWISNQGGPKPLEYSPGSVTARSPWWIDYNHAPPGGGYLHLLFCMFTAGVAYGEAYMEAGGLNRFIETGMPRDFRNARVTVRLKGELETRGAPLSMLVQGTAAGITTGWVLTGSPIEVTRDWSEQTLLLTPDASQWSCLGSRHDRTRSYGSAPLEQVLSDVNADVMFVLFPLDVVPMGPIQGDPHRLRPERDYPVWRSRLPEGYVVLDDVRIEFAV